MLPPGSRNLQLISTYSRNFEHYRGCCDELISVCVCVWVWVWVSYSKSMYNFKFKCLNFFINFVQKLFFSLLMAGSNKLGCLSPASFFSASLQRLALSLTFSCQIGLKKLARYKNRHHTKSVYTKTLRDKVEIKFFYLFGELDYFKILDEMCRIKKWFSILKEGVKAQFFYA